jgi:hypothetical protein
MCGRLYMELWESLVLTRFYKWGVFKTRQASHGLTETRQKGHWKIMSYQGGETEKYAHFRWVDMCKWQRVIPRHKGSPRYRITHGWKMIMDLLNLKPWMHFREPGEFTLHILIFFSFSYFSFFSFFLSFFLSFIHFLLLVIHFFLVRLSPWKSRTSPLNFLSIIFLKIAPLWTLKLHRT